MLESGPLDAKVLSVFDFDGTLTHHDSFVPFLKFAFGKGEFVRRMVKLAVPGAQFLLRVISRDEAQGAVDPHLYDRRGQGVGSAESGSVLPGVLEQADAPNRAAIGGR